MAPFPGRPAEGGIPVGRASRPASAISPTFEAMADHAAETAAELGR